VNLYLISQTVNSDYDTYDSAVVAAETAQQAQETHPSSHYRWHDDAWWFVYSDGRESHWGKQLSNWAAATEVVVKLLSQADTTLPAGVICASFNAG
jgi:hypothetical protein